MGAVQTSPMPEVQMAKSGHAWFPTQQREQAPRPLCDLVAQRRSAVAQEGCAGDALGHLPSTELRPIPPFVSPVDFPGVATVLFGIPKQPVVPSCQVACSCPWRSWSWATG